MSVEKLIKRKQQEYLDKNFDQDTSDVTSPFEEIQRYKRDLLNKIRFRLVENYTIKDINSIKKFDVITKDAWAMIEYENQHSGQQIYLDSTDISDLLEKLIQSMFGYGILEPLINDPTITEIMVNGEKKIFIEKDGKLAIAKNKKGVDLRFTSNEDLLFVIEKIVAPINRKVDESDPIVDARLPNGFRVNVVLNNISLDGTVITIRKFPENPYSMNDLIKFGALPLNVAQFLAKLVSAKYNIIVSGGTGSGKTTFLNALSNFVGKDERVITIEDAAELKIMGVKNLIRLETRPPNIEKKGEITARMLVKSALRMRPDRIIMGECRGGEALDMLQAMNTGHDGSLSTGHSNSAHDMLSRLETMVLMSGLEIPLISIRQQIASAVDIIVHLSKLSDGSRKVTQVTEIIDSNNEGYITQDLFKLDYSDTEVGSSGTLKSTGNQLKNLQKLQFSSINNTLKQNSSKSPDQEDAFFIDDTDFDSWRDKLSSIKQNNQSSEELFKVLADENGCSIKISKTNDGSTNLGAHLKIFTTFK